LALWIWKKAFNRVLREVIKWAMHKLGVEEWLVLAVMSMYTGANAVVRTVCGNSSCFEVKVVMRQGSALSPLLFVIVMEALSGEFRVALPWELYADDLIVITETEDDLITSLNDTHTHTTVLLLFWSMSGTTRVSRYQKGKTRKVRTNLDLPALMSLNIMWRIEA